MMTSEQMMWTIFIVAFGTWVTRFSPFLLFVHKRDGKLPDIVTYLGEVLPAAVMGMLVVYALKDVSLITWPNGIPEGLALIVTCLLYTSPSPRDYAASRMPSSA